MWPLNTTVEITSFICNFLHFKRSVAPMNCRKTCIISVWVCVCGGACCRTCRANKILPSNVQQHLAGGKKCNCPLQWIIGIYVEKQTRPWLGGFVCPNSGNAVFPCGASVWNVRPCTCIPTGGNLRCRVFFKAPDSSPRPTMTLHIERPRCLTLSPRLFTLPKP